MVERAGTKTAAGARVVDLDPDTVAALRLWRTAQADERATRGEAYTDTGYVFTDEAGQPLHADHVANRFDTLVRSAKAPTIRFHDLRHTHATLLLKAGCPSMWSPSASATRRRRSRSRSTANVLPRQQSAAAAAFARLVDERTCQRCGERLAGDDSTGPSCGAEV